MTNNYYVKSDGSKNFHVVITIDSNDALCGYKIPKEFNYQIIFSYPYRNIIICPLCTDIAYKQLEYNKRKEVRETRKARLKMLMTMTNLELLEEYGSNPEYYDHHEYLVLDSYLKYKLRHCGFLK